MSPTYTTEFGVEDAVRQAYYFHHEMVFPNLQDDNDRYFPRRHAEASDSRVAKLEEGESARLAETVPLVVTLNSALDRSMLDQRSLWIEVESLRSKVDEYERQQQQGCQLQDPPPPVLAIDHAIVTSHKRITQAARALTLPLIHRSSHSYALRTSNNASQLSQSSQLSQFRVYVNKSFNNVPTCLS